MSLSFPKDLTPTIATLVAIGATLHLLRPFFQKLVATWSLQQKVQRSKNESTDASVSGLYVHPVKSLRAVSTPTASLDEQGFVRDRRLMVVYPAPLPVWKDKFDPKDTTHRFLTQRQCPSLAKVVATLDETSLQLEYEGSKRVKILLQAPVDPSGKPKLLRAGIWDDQVKVEDMGDEVAAFFQAIVDADEEASANSGMYQKIRLVKHATWDQRLANPKFTPPTARTWLTARPPSVSLTDGFPILIACEASLNEVNRRLREAGKDSIPMSRFRPNIVIQGTEAFEEDRWKYVTIGDQIFAIVKACPRCKQSCTDQETGKVHSEPVSIMKDFRALGAQKEDVFFAQNAIPLGKTGTVSVGDGVRVLERGEPVYC